MTIYNHELSVVIIICDRNSICLVNDITEEVFAASLGIEREQTVVDDGVDVVAHLDNVLQVLDGLCGRRCRDIGKRTRTRGQMATAGKRCDDGKWHLTRISGSTVTALPDQKEHHCLCNPSGPLHTFGAAGSLGCDAPAVKDKQKRVRMQNCVWRVQSMQDQISKPWRG